MTNERQLSQQFESESEKESDEDASPNGDATIAVGNGTCNLDNVKIVDFNKSLARGFDIATIPFNKDEAEHKIRDYIVRGLLAIFALFFGSLIIYMLFGRLFENSLQQSEKVISSLEHLLAILVTLVSGVFGYFFGKNGTGS
ncbi:MAG: CHASE3 domain-containing protein [Burkholderiales bacterium]